MGLVLEVTLLSCFRLFLALDIPGTSGYKESYDNNLNHVDSPGGFTLFTSPRKHPRNARGNLMRGKTAVNSFEV